MSNINDMEKSFVEEAKQFNEASLSVIVDLQEKIQRLESENEHLKSLLKDTVPLIDVNTTDLTLGISNEQLICETQLANLRAYAVTRDLTLEETRKFQTYVDVLEKIKKTQKDNDFRVKKLSDDDLLKLVNTNEQPAS